MTAIAGASLDTVPGEVRSRLPGLEVLSREDLMLLGRQLRRPPQGVVFVARRCPRGVPAVILTMPSRGEGRAVPPLFWLCCPAACARVGTLESRGEAVSIKARLEARPAAGQMFRRDEDLFGELSAALARGAEPGLASRLEGKGAAGGAPGSVKCLHAHLAFRLSLFPAVEDAYDIEERPDEGGIVGAWCEELLAAEGGAWCERPPSPCVA